MKKLFITIALLVKGTSVFAFMMFDVTWDNPPHQVGQAPTTEYILTPPDRPTEVQGAIIRDSVAGFSGQVAVLAGEGNAGIGFTQLSNSYTQVSFTSGVHRISWLAAILTMDPNTSVIAQSIDNDVSCSFLNGGNIRVYSGNSSDTIIGTWALGEVYQFEALLNLDMDTYDFYFNGNQVITGQPLDPNAIISQFGFQRPYGNSEFAVDNIQWEVMSGIPEPGTISLLMLGLPSLCILRRRFQSQKTL